MPALGVYGVDVGAKELAIARHEPEIAFTVPNTTKSISRWLRSLETPAAIGVESTCRYHQRLATLAFAAGHRVIVLDPRRLKAYRKALGFRTKTNRFDSELIALYLARERIGLRTNYRCPSRLRLLCDYFGVAAETSSAGKDCGRRFRTARIATPICAERWLSSRRSSRRSTSTVRRSSLRIRLGELAEHC